ncbi:atrial natriuretic peptide receptor 1-like [Ylistrum balloti]|uniref:atrial natriuretic peptide receptor 1-like n=1 Tax=Ylistrum balloti TaxID=509963 RepID=UPI002905B180|nr:atrial natriuretic peptide receptor 1-like [Ylistrum balloti]
MPSPVHALFLVVICSISMSYVLASKDIVVASVISNGGNLPYDYRRAAPAADLAMLEINSRYAGILNFTYLYRDPGPDCSENDVGAIASDLYHLNNVTGFVGPACSHAVNVVGRMASSWNLPILTPVGTSGTLGDKSNFPTLTRLAYNMNKFAKFYLQVFSQFNWTDVTIMYDQVHVFFRIVGTSLGNEFPSAGISSKVIEFDTNGDFDHRTMLLTASARSRVFVISCHGDTFRDIMLTFYDLRMAFGDYAVIFIRLFEGDDVGNMSWMRNDENDAKAKIAYESVLLVQPRRPESSEFLQFEQDVKTRSLQDYDFVYGNIEVNIFITAFYDSFLIYAQILNETLSDGGNILDGFNLTRRLWGRTFQGIGGTIAIDSNGDRDTDFSLLDMDTTTGNFTVVGNYFGELKQFKFVDGVSIYWPQGKGPPANKPRCGFTGDAPQCQSYELPAVAIAGIAFSCVIVVLTMIAVVAYRRLKLESDLHSSWWKIKSTDLLATNVGSRVISRLSVVQSLGGESKSKEDGAQMFTTTAFFKGSTVATKKFQIKQFNADRVSLLELKQMRDIACPNLTRLIGLAIEPFHVVLVTEYCPRGSLQDILENESIQLDMDFKNALLTDLVQGMAYLHATPIEVHGNLNSSNCVIDGRFVLKITDFGLTRLRQLEQKLNDNHIDHYATAQVWMAPEHLRNFPNRTVSHSGDVYSFGIILFEILTRHEPYEDELEHITVSDVLHKVKRGLDPPFRPMLPQTSEKSDLVKVMKECWNEDPKMRPSFHSLMRTIRKISGITAGHNILDSLLKRMEQYANNLEDLVEERTKAFLDEKRKSEELLYEVLPRSVADQLKNGQSVDPESFESVTIYFSDIVGFTNLSASSLPMQVVDFLNDLYTCFDSILESYDVYKVETIGDAYMVVSGLPVRNGSEHVRQIARMSLSILENVSKFKIRHKPDAILRARIGIHSGSVCAGVVGRKMPRYCLFGDTVNTASRMESNGEAMKIHMSKDTKDMLDAYGNFLIETRGEITVKVRKISHF